MSRSPSPVHVGDVHIAGTVGTGRDIGGAPAWVRGAVVLIPGNGVVIIRGRDDIEIAITIHVGDVDIGGTIRTGRDVGGVQLGSQRRRSRTRQWCRRCPRPRRCRGRHPRPYRPHGHRRHHQHWWRCRPRSSWDRQRHRSRTRQWCRRLPRRPRRCRGRHRHPCRRHERHKHRPHWSRYRRRSSLGHSRRRSRTRRWCRR